MPVTIVVTINARLNDLTELGINDSQYEKNKDCNDGDSYYPIRSHPTTELAMDLKAQAGRALPTTHCPQCLDTSVNITFAF